MLAMLPVQHTSQKLAHDLHAAPLLDRAQFAPANAAAVQPATVAQHQGAVLPTLHSARASAHTHAH